MKGRRVRKKMKEMVKREKKNGGFGVALHEPCPHRAAQDDIDEQEQRKEEWKGKRNK